MINVIIFRSKGKSLTAGASMQDYSVELGVGDCEMHSLHDNALFCQPPHNEPDVDPSHGGAKEGEPTLVVSL